VNPLHVSWWQRAFAIPSPAPLDPQSHTGRALDRLANQAVKRGLAVPAVILLESVRPLQGATARLIPFFEPLWTPLSAIPPGVEPSPATADWKRLLEHPGAIDWLRERIEWYAAPGNHPHEDVARHTPPAAAGLGDPVPAQCDSDSPARIAEGDQT
jgi:hypothetical protein